MREIPEIRPIWEGIVKNGKFLNYKVNFYSYSREQIRLYFDQLYVDYIDSITNSNSGMGMDSKSIRVETTPDRSSTIDTTVVNLDDKEIK